MAKKEFRPLFGVKGDTWMKVDGVSTIMFTTVITRRALQGLGKNGVFGYGKNKTLKNGSAELIYEVIGINENKLLSDLDAHKSVSDITLVAYGNNG